MESHCVFDLTLFGMHLMYVLLFVVRRHPVLSKQQQLWCHLVGETELTGNWKEKFVNYKCRE